MDNRETVTKITKDVDRRNKTDIRIYPFMVFIVLVIFIVVSMYQVTQLVDKGSDVRLQSTGVFVAGIGVVISIMYLLMSRRYSHEDRDLALMRDLMEYTKEEFDRYGIKEDHHINDMRSCIKAESGLRSFRIRFAVSVAPAALGLLLMMFNPFSDEIFHTTIFLFVASLAINLMFLLGCIVYPRKHEKNFVKFSDAFVDAMCRCGIRVKGYEPVIGFRPTILFVILSVLTCGLFFAFWLYLSMRDMNRHLDEQWNFEDSVMDSILM
ncbi:MAG: hypothetical protein ACI4Q9_03500 [Candidatus Methanomethylophilaceae archaeon]